MDTTNAEGRNVGLSAGLEPLPKAHQKGWIYTSAQMREYAAQCVVAEREACALLCANIYAWPGAYSAGMMCARTLETAVAAIRSRGSCEP